MKTTTPELEAVVLCLQEERELFRLICLHNANWYNMAKSLYIQDFSLTIDISEINTDALEFIAFIDGNGFKVKESYAGKSTHRYKITRLESEDIWRW